jgi:hypothetical protein
MRQARALLRASAAEGDPDDLEHLAGYAQTAGLFDPFPHAPIPFTTTTKNREPSTREVVPVWAIVPGPFSLDVRNWVTPDPRRAPLKAHSHASPPARTTAICRAYVVLMRW